MHRVSSHTRTVDGKKVPVSSYVRGEGQKKNNSPVIQTRRVSGKDEDGGKDQWEYFQVYFIYEDDSTEHIPVLAKDADDALNLALAERENTTMKIKTSIVQDGLGDTIKSFAKGINKRKAEIELKQEAQRERVRDIKRGVKKRIKAIKEAPSRFKQSIIDEAEEGEIEALMKAVQSGKKFKVRAAKRKLKQKYPLVYNSIAWSRV